MSAFSYRDGQLHAEGVALAKLADEVGTPTYVYSSGQLTQTFQRYCQALSGLNGLICYALKANSNQAVISTLAQQGAGADVVSEGEMLRALKAGIDPGRIVFAGVGKTDREMAKALATDIFQFNVESLPELEALNRVAMAAGKKAPVALRINPDVDAGTHEKISTGKAENKFGIAFDGAPAIAAAAKAMPGIDLKGLAVHIGSQLTDLAPYREAFKRMIELYRRLNAAGQGLERIDFGGGLGIAYRDEKPPSIESYAEMVKGLVQGLDARFIFEPGRSLVGEAGILLTRVIYVKRGTSRSFLVVDGAMNDLIRPTLYEAWHDIVPIEQPREDQAVERYDIVGPVCESGDFFAKQRPLPPVQPGDLLAICDAGAYGAVMSSTYNTRPLVSEVLIAGERFHLVRPRQDYATLLNQDRLPPWLLPEGQMRGAAE